MSTASSAAPASPTAPLLLISMDGFRWDYCELHPNETPTLRRLKAEGFSAAALIPVFPSNTFPNHYTLVTGLHPTNHGIVNNDFLDADSGLFFHYTQSASVRDSRWWGGEPIWVTAIKQGQKAAAYFWIGSEAEIKGVRPTFWKPYDYSIPFDKRLDELLGWLTLPIAERPTFVAFYFDETNRMGHEFGPSSPELVAALKYLDGCIATMLARCAAAGIDPNVVVVSDHGMTPTALERVVVLDDYIPANSALVITDGSAVSLQPNDGDIAALEQRLQKVPHGQVYRAEKLPERFHATPSRRRAPLWIVADEGWQVVARTTFERLRTRYAENGFLNGDHGYDPALPSMHGLLIAHGPAFRRGVTIPAVENIHLYNLLCAALNVKPAPNDGDDRLVKAALR